MNLDEELFSDDERLTWKQILENRKTDILNEEISLKKQAFAELAETGEISKIRQHPADLASNTQQIEMLGTLSEKKIKAVQEVEGALERLERGSYGICLSCEEPIPKKRLKIIPETRYCLDCEQDIELARKTQRRSIV